MTSPAFPLFKLKLNFLPTPRSLSLPMCESMVTMQKISAVSFVMHVHLHLGHLPAPLCLFLLRVLIVFRAFIFLFCVLLDRFHVVLIPLCSPCFHDLHAFLGIPYNCFQIKHLIDKIRCVSQCNHCWSFPNVVDPRLR